MAGDLLMIGNGPRKVLALHGWFGSATGWGPFADLVDANRYNHLFLDYRVRRAARGGGRAQPRGDLGGRPRRRRCARLVLLRRAGALHGWQCDAAGALGRGDRVSRLIGVSPVPSTGVPFDERSEQLFSGAAGNRDNRDAIIDLTTGGRLSRTWLDRMVQGNPAPVRVVVGEHDPALGAAVMQQTLLRQYPNASLEVLPNAGHYAVFETPAALLTTVERFLDQL
jgi:pimeloyl-ACP methyl ester carboxylesterase